MEERRFVCKYCSKKFPCGKSLGGHIRTHMMNEHSLSATMPYANINSSSSSLILEFEYPNRKRKHDFLATNGSNSSYGGSGYGYGLRENPKKTKSFVDANHNKLCKECGKGFPSLKALCGHMACHSEKERGTNSNSNNRFQFESNSGISEKQKLVMDSHSDTETSVPIRRSKRMRFRNLSKNNRKPFCSSSSSSSVSEVEQEQEEVARCLMMLSKDNSYKGQFVLFAESSDNKSIVLEGKSPSVDTYNKVMVVDHEKNQHKGAEIGYNSDNSDSGYFRYGPKKNVDSDDDDGEVNNNVDSRSGVRSRNNSLFKKMAAANDSSSKKKNKPNGITGFSDKHWKVESFTTEDFSAFEIDEFNNNSTDTDSYPAAAANASKSRCNKKINENNKGKTKKKSKKKKLKSKKNKEHECPICNKMFRSGQALGGHKRSHFVGGSEENTLVIRPAPATVAPCLIDLNLPAPVDDAPF
ncbi:hypothetical protein S245_016752 [Arachis hypogaea]